MSEILAGVISIFAFAVIYICIDARAEARRRK